jgi:glycosyltransferase involved in cell wall biosynthesis
VPTDSGAGVAYAATLLLEALADQGTAVHCFLAAPAEDVPERLRQHPNITFTTTPSAFRYGRWYSRTDTTKLISGSASNALMQFRLARQVAEAHQRDPFDVLYQFSHLETSALRRLERRLPPVVLHPEVHARGELRWLLKERRLARESGTLGRLGVVAGLMATRSLAQGRGARRVRAVVAPSRHFADLLHADYGIPSDRLRVVANPIDVERFHPADGRSETNPIRLLFMSRVAVRKGVDVIVPLTHRLADLEGKLLIEVVGDRSLFSDYRPLLEGMNPGIGRYLGGAAATDVQPHYARAHALLQPSWYEPFALTVGEALACGLPVVASAEVGATEGVDSDVCRVAPAGDLAGFERHIRRLVLELSSSGRRAELRDGARAEATRLFAPDVVGSQLLTALLP